MKIERFLLSDGKYVEIPFPESYSDCMDLVRSDYYRVSGKVVTNWFLVKNSLRHLNDSSLFWLRLCQYRGFFFRLFCHIYTKISHRVCIYIPPMTRIGYGLDIGHGMSIVVNGGTIIGNNVCLSHFVSIGTNHNTPAIIGDNVYIGPNTNIIEDIRIGNNVTIGAGSVVTKDIPANSTAVGSPSRVINEKNPGRYIKNPYHPAKD